MNSDIDSIEHCINRIDLVQLCRLHVSFIIASFLASVLFVSHCVHMAPLTSLIGNFSN